MRQFESMLTLYHLLPARSWSSLQTLHAQCESVGIECSSHTLRRWLKAWVAAGFVEEREGRREYQYRQSAHQPFISLNQDAVLLHWLSRYFAPLLPDTLRRLLESRLMLSETKVYQSTALRQYVSHIQIDLPLLPAHYLPNLTLLKQALTKPQALLCVFIGQSIFLQPQAIMLNSQGWWLRYLVKRSCEDQTEDEDTHLQTHSLLCLLWIEE